MAADAMELQAWYALNLARAGNVDDGLEVAEDLLERAPEDPWAWFAMAGTVHRQRERSNEALKASEKALAATPTTQSSFRPGPASSEPRRAMVFPSSSDTDIRMG